MTVPVATLPDNLNERAVAEAAYTMATATRGNFDYWLWEPYALSVVVPFRMERVKQTGFVWGWGFDFAYLIAISDKNEESDVVFQTSADLGYQAMEWLRVGGLFNFALWPRVDGQKTQLSIEPYLRIGRDDQFVTARLLVNLDNPYGFSFDKNKIWGLRIGAGMAF
ncbi:MAG: hypothetical protein R3A47_04920 [Polyangiales bacterium]